MGETNMSHELLIISIKECNMFDISYYLRDL